MKIFMFLKEQLMIKLLKRALTIMLISFAIALTGLFILSISEQQILLIYFLKFFSAFATVGLTAGLTPNTDICWKNCYNYLMYIGRIGPITMV